MKPSEVEWLLDCEPRAIQQEALLRSYYGFRSRDTIGDPMAPTKIREGPARGWAHFMEMRTGKTPTILNEFLLLEAHHGVKNAIIFSPNRFKKTWGTEAKKFGVPHRVHVFESSDRFKAKVFIRRSERVGILVVNYEALTYDSNIDIISKWVGPDTYVASDESVNLKNRNSLRTKRILNLTRHCRYKRVATGLPTPQAPFDLWAQLRCIGELDGYPFYAFRNKYTIMGGWRGKQPQGIRNSESLDRLLDRMSFRARRGDWSDRMDNDYEIMQLELLPKQQVSYVEMEKDMITYVSENEWVTVEMVISKVIKLQQICSGFLMDEGKVHDLVPFDKTPKFLDLIDRMANMIEHKVIVVTHYTYTTQKLYEYFEALGYNPAIITGSQSMPKRMTVESQVAKFNEDPKCKVLVGQGQALKYGFTLMGNKEHPCHTIVFYENSYSLDTRAQCEERPQGVDQTAPLHVLDYASSVIESKIIATLQGKKDVAETVMGYIKEKT